MILLNATLVINIPIRARCTCTRAATKFIAVLYTRQFTTDQTGQSCTTPHALSWTLSRWFRSSCAVLLVFVFASTSERFGFAFPVSSFRFAHRYSFTCLVFNMNEFHF
ncbi:hypothetical protein BT96DRAFT_54011 [Gymnopus androsaceus JB14]|uniref:Uncharacterized protein n=1 Tax=Gymnopus androsaceus JB14 TaxID=1447944 RepID=A0A6A4IGL6_9AGAR|nr:hypothetical protein BT96DRAFT_54011 [Gymnopus androsaceus JB14]